MNKLNQHQFYVPASGAQKFEFYVGTQNPLTVIREENWFYQVEQDGKKAPLGNLVSTCQYLYRCQAQWFTKENRKKRMFYHHRSDVMQFLREGYTVVHVESGNRLSYTEDYSRIVCSSSIVLENDVPPGNYCIDFTESKLAKTYNEVKAQQLFAKVQEEKLEKEKSEARRETARILFERIEKQKKIEERNRREAAKNQFKRTKKEDSTKLEPAENESFLKFVGAAAIFLGGLGLGLLIKH